MTQLQDLKTCFEGAIPSTIVSCGKVGIPNCVNISQVWFVDNKHVALSRQFFRRTAQNIAENPMVCVQVIEPVSSQAWSILGRYVRSEETGPLFEEMRATLDTIAS